MKAPAKEELSGCGWPCQTERNDQESWEESTERDTFSHRAGRWKQNGKEEALRPNDGWEDPGAEIRKWYRGESTSQTLTEEV